MTRLAIIFSFVVVLCACGSGTDVRFKNSSEYPLEAVELSGSGFKASLGTVAPGRSLTAEIYPSGETGLAVSFTAKGRRYTYEPQDYFEAGGYRVSAKVDGSLAISVETETTLY